MGGSFRLQDVSLSKKFAGALVVFIVPILLLCSFLYLERIAQINVSKKELSGLAYLRSVQQTMEFLTVSTPSADELNSAAKSLAKAEEMDGGLLGVTEQTQDLIKRVNRVASGKDPTSTIVRTNDLITAIADKSGISLDPDLDTYYLGSTLFIRSIIVAEKTNDMIVAAADLARNDKSQDFQIAYALALLISTQAREHSGRILERRFLVEG